MDQQLKQRLVGAVVLVSLAVIFIPVILEGPDDEWSPRDHTIPEAPRVDYRAAMDLPLPDVQPDDRADVAGGMQQADPQPTAALKEEQPVKTRAKPVPKPEPAPEKNKLESGWYAQVGSFSQPANAAGLRDSIAGAGFRAHLQEVASAQGTSYRVLAGPESSREQAEQLLGKLGKTLNTTGIVIGIGTPDK
jgi:DedD protein